MRKFPLLVKSNAALPFEYLRQQLILWGKNPDEVPPKAAAVLAAVNTHLEDNLKLKAKKLKVYFFAVNNKLYLLNASPPLEANNQALIDLDIKGLGAVNLKLGEDPKNWDRFVFTAPEYISDPVARLQATNLSDPLKFDSEFKVERKSNFDMSQISKEDEMDNVCDMLLDEGQFMYQDVWNSSNEPSNSCNEDAATKTESQDNYEPVVEQFKNIDINTIEVSPGDKTSAALANAFAKDIRIQRFDAEKQDAQTWVANNCYELEMAGLRDEKKIIARLLSGLPDELRYAVRIDLQTNFPKKDGVYGGTVADFVKILKEHSMQTVADMQESLQMLQLGSQKDLRRFYYQIKSLVDSTLSDKQRDSGVSELIASSKFREKLPNYLRNNQLIASSTESGLKLVSLCQRVMNRCKSDNVAANTFNTKGYNNNNNKGRKGQQGRGQQRYNAKSKPNKDKDIECHFCGLRGHRLDNCYSYNAAKKSRRDEIARKASSSKSK